MKSRRKFIGVTTAALFGLPARAQVSQPPPVNELARHELTGLQAGLEAVLVEVTAPPGTPSHVHRHPGFVLGYVLEGEMNFAINSEPPRVVKTGGTFFEPSGAIHTTGGSADQGKPVRFLAFLVAPKGSPVTLPVQAK